MTHHDHPPPSCCCSREQRSLLLKCAATALSSKLIAHQKDFFSTMVVDAVSMLDELLPLNMIGIKKVQGGSLEVRAIVFLTNYCAYCACIPQHDVGLLEILVDSS